MAVADVRSVSRAARVLHVTQRALSRRAQRLEAAIGADLCDRRRRSFILTVAGQAALERCRRVLHAVRDVRSAAGGDDPPPREIRVGVAHALTEVALTEPVDRLRRAFPRVSLSVDAAVILLPDGERYPAGSRAAPARPPRRGVRLRVAVETYT
jgi:DNA-binding transcriptional LysR family regulator